MIVTHSKSSFHYHLTFSALEAICMKLFVVHIFWFNKTIKHTDRFVTTSTMFFRCVHVTFSRTIRKFSCYLWLYRRGIGIWIVKVFATGRTFKTPLVESPIIEHYNVI